MHCFDLKARRKGARMADQNLISPCAEWAKKQAKCMVAYQQILAQLTFLPSSCS
jgi:hypothetical protein